MTLASPRPRQQAAKMSLNVPWDNKYLQALDTQRRRPLICNLLQDHYINYPVKASASQRKLGNSESLEMKDCMQGKFYFTRTNPSPSPSFEPKKEVPPRLRLKKKNSENQKAFFGNNITKINEWKRASGRYSADLLDAMINEIMETR